MSNVEATTARPLVGHESVPGIVFPLGSLGWYHVRRRCRGTRALIRAPKSGEALSTRYTVRYARVIRPRRTHHREHLTPDFPEESKKRRGSRAPAGTTCTVNPASPDLGAERIAVGGKVASCDSSCGIGMRVGTWPPGTPNSMVPSRRQRRASIHRVPCSTFSENQRSYNNSPSRLASDMEVQVPDAIAGRRPEFVR